MKFLKDIDFVAMVLSVEIFFYGCYLLYEDTYFAQRFDLNTLTPSLENGIGVLCMVIAVTKLLGIIKNIRVLKRIGIIGMSLVWAMIVGLYIFEAFNGGFLGLIWSVPILMICLRIARRGDYIE